MAAARLHAALLLAALTLLPASAAAGPPKWINDTMALVLEMKLVDAAIAVWSAYIGELTFFTLVSATIVGIVWISTNSIIAAGVSAAILGLILGSVHPEWKYLGFLLVLIGFAAAIYRLLKE